MTAVHQKRHVRILTILTALLLTTSLLIGSKAVWIAGKAGLAQILLQTAWQRSLQTGTAQKPWLWADVTTVARLEAPALHTSLIVLNDASGEAMAFGPGLVAGDLARSSDSAIAIGGHRDTHLSFLQHLETGMTLNLATLDGSLQMYELVRTEVVDTRRQSLRLAADQAGLALITCYPFDPTQTGGPLRLVAIARPRTTHSQFNQMRDLRATRDDVLPDV